jgi:hypothetical protein
VFSYGFQEKISRVSVLISNCLTLLHQFNAAWQDPYEELRVFALIGVSMGDSAEVEVEEQENGLFTVH